MSIFRSEDMKLYMLQFEKNDARLVMGKLGELSSLHFIDVFEDNKNSIGRRPFSSVSQRCEEIKSSIKYIENCCNEYGISLPEPVNWSHYITASIYDTSQKGKSSMAYFEDIERTLKCTVAFLKNQISKMEEALQEYKQLIERHQVFKIASNIIKAYTNKYIINIY